MPCAGLSWGGLRDTAGRRGRRGFRLQGGWIRKLFKRQHPHYPQTHPKTGESKFEHSEILRAYSAPWPPTAPGAAYGVRGDHDHVRMVKSLELRFHGITEMIFTAPQGISELSRHFHKYYHFQRPQHFTGEERVPPRWKWFGSRSCNS